MIRLSGIEKRFPGQTVPAVRHLDLDIPRGEVVVLVGPSGCGKTTTLRLINRLIEPTAGRIELDGEDVTEVDPDALRRRMGYVIQQIGLFPHMTIAENIGMVPRILGWDADRIRARVDELLELVGLAADEYRGRYPKELSGGQSQRVGVARAMAADPPVLLMDEPFGAIDPITRARLQDEFQRVQDTVAKTVVFVTHDIDEAVKMGDRIVLLRVGGEIAQYDTPERILAAPADDFVASFIGAGARVRGLTLTRLSDVEATPWPTVEPGELERLDATDGRPLLVLEDGRPSRWVVAGDGAGTPVDTVLRRDVSLHDALDALIGSESGRAVVVDEDGRGRDVVELDTIRAAVVAMRRRHADEATA